MTHAKRNKQIGGYNYKGYYFDQPEGTSSWNIYTIHNGKIDFCFPISYCNSFKECKITIDYIYDEATKTQNKIIKNS